MTPTGTSRAAPIRQVARLGFDHGWWLLPPTFLNLKVPVLIVDHAFIGDPEPFGLEPFGTRDPSKPLPMTELLIERLGEVIFLRQRLTRAVVAVASVHVNHPIALREGQAVALLIGNSYELELTWDALWSAFIGFAPIMPTIGTVHPSARR